MITHVPLEPLAARYTEYLGAIENAAFGAAFGGVETVLGNPVATAIKQGRVLDSINRPLYALSQVSQLITKPPVSRETPIYFSDFYTTGLDGLAYAGFENPMFAFLWAQTFDQYDFTTEMINWFRPWEHMAFEIYRGVFVASSLLKELIVSAIPSMLDKVHVVGLPFNSTHVRSLMKAEDVPSAGFDCVYSSRFDKEKNPDFFLDVVEAMPETQFVICTGHEILRGTDQIAVARALAIAARKDSNLEIRTGLTKSQYFGVLRASLTQFNSSLQDWVSFTLLEALTFECVPVYPSHRSFPEALDYDYRLMYRPNDVTDAVECLSEHIQVMPPKKLDHLLVKHDNALGEISAIIKSCL